MLAQCKAPFAIRGDDHTINARAVNIEGGATISLRAVKDEKSMIRHQFRSLEQKGVSCVQCWMDWGVRRAAEELLMLELED